MYKEAKVISGTHNCELCKKQFNYTAQIMNGKPGDVIIFSHNDTNAGVVRKDHENKEFHLKKYCPVATCGKLNYWIHKE